MLKSIILEEGKEGKKKFLGVLPYNTRFVIRFACTAREEEEGGREERGERRGGGEKYFLEALRGRSTLRFSSCRKLLCNSFRACEGFRSFAAFLVVEISAQTICKQNI
jgi:hypothetical protein